MKLIEGGIVNVSQPGAHRAVATFPSVTVLPDQSLISAYRIGSDKDDPGATVELRRSFNNGRSWSEPAAPFSRIFNGRSGELRCVYLTPLSEAHLLACALWVDRESYPGKPLFNPETEGCLPMAILLADSYDIGSTWTRWRIAPVTADVGPPSLTSPVLRLADGKLAISIETNKSYNDRSKWRQRVAYIFSEDGGKTWSAPYTICADPHARLYTWDQRAAIAPDGRVVTFSWTYDREKRSYLNILRRISSDGAKTWSAPVDLGFADQPSHPAILPDGRVVLAWVDRYRSESIRVRLAQDLDAPFLPETELVLYNHRQQRVSAHNDVGGILTDMSVWSYGLPYAEALRNGEVMVVYYAGTDSAMDVHWRRLSVN